MKYVTATVIIIIAVFVSIAIFAQNENDTKQATNTLNATPTKTPVISTIKATPKQTPAPTIRLTQRCDTQTYTLGSVSSNFIGSGYDKDMLLKIVQAAANRWNAATDEEIFRYDPTSKNTINFTDGSQTERYDHIGITHQYKYENGAVANFNVEIPLMILTYNNRTALLNDTTLHELGHAIGLGHIENYDAVMYGNARPQQSGAARELTQADITALVSFCNNK